MKREWKKPALEILDVNMTMLGHKGEFTDATYDAHTPKGDLTFS
jgi:hypothetical protein